MMEVEHIGEVEYVKNELRKIIRERYKNKSDLFFNIADEIITLFGYVYPLDTEELIDRIAKLVE